MGWVGLVELLDLVPSISRQHLYGLHLVCKQVVLSQAELGVKNTSHLSPVARIENEAAETRVGVDIDVLDLYNELQEVDDLDVLVYLDTDSNRLVIGHVFIALLEFVDVRVVHILLANRSVLLRLYPLHKGFSSRVAVSAANVFQLIGEAVDCDV